MGNEANCLICMSIVSIITITAIHLSLYYNLHTRHRAIKKVTLCDIGINNIRIDNTSLPFNSIYDSHVWKETMRDSIHWNQTTDIPDYVMDRYPLAVDMVQLVQRYKDLNGKILYNIINPYRHNFTLKPKILPCEGLSINHNSCQHVYLLFLIKSHFYNSDRRQAIRETWTNVKNITNHCVKRVFLIGGFPVRSEKYKVLINNEDMLHRDLLQMDFTENYYRNTWKTRGGLKWAAKFCASAKYVMLVDDDYYVATDLLIQQLEEINLPERLFMGWSFIHPKPFREKSSRWYVSLKEFPYNVYPNFHAAGAIVMSMNVVQDIDIAAQYTKHFIFDDVFLALVVGKLNISLVTNNLLRNRKMHFMETKFWNIIASHDYWNPADLQDAWKCHLHYKYTRLERNLFIQGR